MHGIMGFTVNIEPGFCWQCFFFVSYCLQFSSQSGFLKNRKVAMKEHLTDKQRESQMRDRV